MIIIEYNDYLGPPVAGLAGNLGQTAGFGSTGLFGGGTTQPAGMTQILNVRWITC